MLYGHGLRGNTVSIPHAVDNAIVAVVPPEDLQKPDAEISQAELQQIIARLNNS